MQVYFFFCDDYVSGQLSTSTYLHYYLCSLKLLSYGEKNCYKVNLMNIKIMRNISV